MKEHFEPILRVAQPAIHQHSHTRSSATAAASAALSKDVFGVSKYNPSASSRGSRLAKDKKGARGSKDEFPEYKTRLAISGLANAEQADLNMLASLDSVEDIATLEQRWGNSWQGSIQAR